MKAKGVYDTYHGTTAYVAGPKAQTAYDLDMGQRIPITEVTDTLVRRANAEDQAEASKAGRLSSW